MFSQYSIVSSVTPPAREEKGRSDNTKASFPQRAGRACLKCRARKVRCDAEEQGIPCRNCRRDGVSCEMRKCQRGRRRNRGLNVRVLRMTTPDQDSRFLQHRLENTTEWLRTPAPTRQPSLPLESFTPADTSFLKNRASAIDQSLLHQELSFASLIDPKNLISTSCLEISPPHSVCSDPTPNLDLDSEPADSAESLWFLQPLPSSVSDNTKRYLRAERALCVPQRAFRNEIIRCFVRYVHPWMPVLDISALVKCMKSPDEAGGSPKSRMSILLFQAVMFAAVGFADEDMIVEAGFPTRKDARRAFYQRASLLYKVDTEFDRLTTVQSLILMSYWVEGAGESRGGWHWMGEAFSVAVTIGLHRRKDYERLTPKESQLRRRVFWAYYIRDRLLGLGLGRLMRVREGEYDTPMLTLSDFDFDRLEAEADETDEPVMTSDEQTSLSEMCISMAKLCTLIEPILSLHFSFLPNDESPEYSSHRKDRTTSLLFFKSSSTNISIDDVKRRDQGLDGWSSQLPSSCTYRKPTKHGERWNLCTILAALLRMTFSAVVSALHRPLLHANALREHHEYRLLSQRRFHDAADDISRICHDLSSHGLDGYLLPTSLIIQLPAIITHLRRLRSPLPAHQRQRQQAQEGLDRILYSLRFSMKLQTVYVGGETVMSHIFQLLNMSKITVLNDGPGPDGRLVGLAFEELVSSDFDCEPGQLTDDAAAAAQELSFGNGQSASGGDGIIIGSSQCNQSASASASAVIPAASDESATVHGHVLEDGDEEVPLPLGLGPIDAELPSLPTTTIDFDPPPAMDENLMVEGEDLDFDFLNFIDEAWETELEWAHMEGLDCLSL